MFWNSMSDVEKQHMINAFSFELGKCETESIRIQVLEMFSNVSHELVKAVAENLGLPVPSVKPVLTDKVSPALSQMNTVKKPDTRKIAVLAADGFTKDLPLWLQTLKSKGTMPEIISDHHGKIVGEDGTELEVKHTLLTADSVLFDAVLVAGKQGKTPIFAKEVPDFVEEAFLHYKPVGALNEGCDILAGLEGVAGAGVVQNDIDAYIDAVTEARFWDRNGKP